jgi:hypothetical protein
VDLFLDLLLSRRSIPKNTSNLLFGLREKLLGSERFGGLFAIQLVSGWAGIETVLESAPALYMFRLEIHMNSAN